MKKSNVLFIIAILITGLYSCNVTGIVGSKNVIKEDRTITEAFNSIKVSEGIEVLLEKSDVTSVSVEADDNIIGLLITEVKDGVLNIYFDDFVGRVKSKKVYISINTFDAISTSSGASLKAVGSFSGDVMEFNASSGSDIEIEIEANNVICNASSGSDLHILGTSTNLDADASSGSDINAGGLKVNTADVNASSGSEMDIFVTEKLTADASSGADIKYSGNPANKEISKSSGGNVSPK